VWHIRIYDVKCGFQDTDRHYYEISQVDKHTVIDIMGEQTTGQTNNPDEIIEAQSLDVLSKVAIC
jgi:hypothetical protein